MELTDRERDKLIAKIRALQAKTVKRGSTEAEAMAAAAKVDQLLRDYNLTLTEEVVRNANHIRGSLDLTLATGTFIHPVQFALYGVEAFCEVKVWLSSRNNRKFVVMFGEHQDVLVSQYLVGLMRAAIDTEYEAWKRDQQRHGLKVNPWAFRNAMGKKLGARLVAMKRARDTEVTATTGTSLVVVKQQAVEESFKSLDLKLRSKKSTSGRVSDAAAALAGMAAADRVALNPGLGGPQARSALK
ncbi:MAG: hypothetical protein RJA36_1420 [Pseudomonadota bacterium]|jgi:hypothetical protein